MFRKFLALVPALAVLTAEPALAQTRLQLSTGLHYSSGKFGDNEHTDVIVAPFAAKLQHKRLTLRAWVPYVSIRGPADVAVVLDESGSTGSASGAGASGSGGGGGSWSMDAAPRTTRIMGTSTGIGDAVVSATYAFNSLFETPLYADVTGRVRLPTGDDSRGLGLGATDYAILGEVGAERRWGGLYLSGGHRFLDDVDGLSRRNGWQLGTGFWLDRGKTALGLEYDWRAASFDGGKDPSEVAAFVSYRLKENWKISLDVSAGLNDATADFGVGLNLVWRPMDQAHN